jgi:tetratricopeptide (TPR) repeat protein
VRRCAVLLAAALAAKAAVLVQLHAHPLLQPAGELDSAVYVRLAERAAAGDWALGPDAYFVSPLYVYSLAVVLRLFGSALAAQALQVALGAAAVGLVFATARRIWGASAGWVAAGLMALTGVLTFNEVLLLQSALDPFLSALALWALARAVGAWRTRDLCVAGAALGLLALNRPNALVVGGVLLPAILLARFSREGLRSAAAFALGLALTLAPVALRNRVVSGEWLLVSSHGGLNFYIGNNAEADGTYHAVPGITPSIAGQAGDSRRVAEAEAGRPLSASEVSDHFYRKAGSWIAAHPGVAAALLLRKLGYVLNQTDLSLNYSYAYYARDEATLLRALVVGPWLLVPLGLLGLVATPPASGRAGYRVWALFAPAYALSVAAFFVASRYRLPLLVALCTTSGAGAVQIVEALRTRRRPWLVGAAAVLLPLALLANWNFGLDDGTSGERTEMALALVDRHRDAEARELVARAEPHHPQPALLLYRVGRAYLERGASAEAVSYLKRAASLDAGRAEVRLALGQALLDAGRLEDAVPHLAAARDAGVRPDLAGFDLARALLALGRRAEAREALRHTPVAASADAASLLALGTLALELEDAALAESALRRAVERWPESADAHEKLGLALAWQGRRDEAAAQLETACRLDPTLASAQLNLAVVLAQQGRLGEARARATEALRLRPSYPQALALLRDLGADPPAGAR